MTLPLDTAPKTQVYQLADYLGVPEEIGSRPPTTDTYSLPLSHFLEGDA
jgi:NAD+ synthase